MVLHVLRYEVLFRGHDLSYSFYVDTYRLWSKSYPLTFDTGNVFRALVRSAARLLYQNK